MEIHKGKIGPLDGPKKPCGGCLGCDPVGPERRPFEPDNGQPEPDEGVSPDVDYDPNDDA